MTFLQTVITLFFSRYLICRAVVRSGNLFGEEAASLAAAAASKLTVGGAAARQLNLSGSGLTEVPQEVGLRCHSPLVISMHPTVLPHLPTPSCFCLAMLHCTRCFLSLQGVCLVLSLYAAVLGRLRMLWLLLYGTPAGLGGLCVGACNLGPQQEPGRAKQAWQSGCRQEWCELRGIIAGDSLHCRFPASIQRPWLAASS